jgi:hypothetical protein
MVALLPVVALLLVLAWQAVLTGHAEWAAGTAARAAARAAATGGAPRAAATARLDERLERGLRVRDEGDGAVEVSLRVPTLPGLPRLGAVTASARFAPQR